MRVLILIIASDNIPVYNQLQKLWKQQFGKHPSIDCYFIKANPELKTEYEITDDTVYVKGAEDYTYGILYKSLVAMKAFQAENYDYIIRSNLSSFYILDRLYKELSSLPRENCYAGVMGRHDTINFVSGCGFVVSKDIASYMVEHLDKVWDDFVRHDDVCFGKFIFKHFPDSYKPISRYDLIYPAKPLFLSLQEIQGQNVCHVRIKHEHARELDVKAREALLLLFN